MDRNKEKAIMIQKKKTRLECKKAEEAKISQSVYNMDVRESIKLN